LQASPQPLTCSPLHRRERKLSCTHARQVHYRSRLGSQRGRAPKTASCSDLKQPGPGCCASSQLCSQAAQCRQRRRQQHRHPVPGRLRAAPLGTTQLAHFPAWLASSDVLSAGFAGDSPFQQPVLLHSCALTRGGARRAALTQAYVAIKSFAGCSRRVLLKALPHNRVILFGGFVREVPQLRAGPGSSLALKPQSAARTGTHLHFTESLPPAAVCCEEVVVKVGKKPF